MGQNGFLPQDLFFLRKMWDDSGVLVEDSYGQEWVRQSIPIAHTVNPERIASVIFNDFINPATLTSLYDNDFSRVLHAHAHNVAH